MDEGWIVIPNWDKFQHYKDRRPPWIKTYVDLLHRDEYLDLTPRRRSILHDLWITYAERDGLVRHRTATLSRLFGHRVMSADLKALNQAGFIEIVASKPQPQRQRHIHKELAHELENPETRKRNAAQARRLAKRLKGTK